MPRNKEDIFKKNAKETIFVMGDTDEERAKLLYIRHGLSNTKIAKRLKDFNSAEISVKTISSWIQRGGWKELRKKYQLQYEKKQVSKQATADATADVNSQEEVKTVYGSMAGTVMNMIKQKLDFSKSQFGPAPLQDAKEIYLLSQAMKNLKDVHFSALGIQEVTIVDPTAQNDEIVVMTKNDLARLKGE